ncbi:hypothetical protein J8273_5469 [Carpediemonas membranifera]|uniref:Uncharacterized protein n=1 Tax=Carpediemonas membranifera TaxID=201153 RepID=A0A8J6B418_9EUKA|nr:hypothetical protein J8273_5469 [Carpediemonas membranifera]|eukprot:KAG9392477.1 hypothetical protein J8273_5469 [Carpediemonas membranifera]
MSASRPIELEELLNVSPDNNVVIRCVASFSFRSVYLVAAYMDDGVNGSLAISLEISMFPKCIRTVPLDHKRANSEVVQMIFSPDARWVILASVQGTFACFSLEHIFPSLYTFVIQEYPSLNIPPPGSANPRNKPTPQCSQFSVKLSGVLDAETLGFSSRVNHHALSDRTLWWVAPNGRHFIILVTSTGIAFIDVSAGSLALFVPIPRLPVAGIAILHSKPQQRTSLLVQCKGPLLRLPLEVQGTVVIDNWGKRPFLMSSIATIDSARHNISVVPARDDDTLGVFDSEDQTMLLHDSLMTVHPLRVCSVSLPGERVVAVLPWNVYALALIETDTGVRVKVLSNRLSTEDSAFYLEDTFDIPLESKDVDYLPAHTMLMHTPQVPPTKDAIVSFPRVLLVTCKRVYSLSASSLEESIRNGAARFAMEKVTRSQDPISDFESADRFVKDLAILSRATKADIYSVFERLATDNPPSFRTAVMAFACLDRQIIEQGLGPQHLVRSLAAKMIESEPDPKARAWMLQRLVETCGNPPPSGEMAVAVGLLAFIMLVNGDDTGLPVPETPLADLFDLTPAESIVAYLLHASPTPDIVHTIFGCGYSRLALAVASKYPKLIADVLASCGCVDFMELLPILDRNDLINALVANRPLIVALPPESAVRLLMTVPHGAAVVEYQAYFASLLPALGLDELLLIADYSQPPAGPRDLVELNAMACMYIAHRTITQAESKSESESESHDSSPARWIGVDPARAHSTALAEIRRSSHHMRPRMLVRLGGHARTLGLRSLECSIARTAKDPLWVLEAEHRAGVGAIDLFDRMISLCKTMCRSDLVTQETIATYLGLTMDVDSSVAAVVTDRVLDLAGTDLFESFANAIFKYRIPGPLEQRALIRLLRVRAQLG